MTDLHSERIVAYMNHIHRLITEREAAQAEVTALRAGIAELSAYLSSDEFVVDPTVQTADVMRRLVEIGSTSADAYFTALRAHRKENVA